MFKKLLVVFMSVFVLTGCGSGKENSEVEALKKELHDVKEQYALLEKEYAEVKKEWGELTGIIEEGVIGKVIYATDAEEMDHPEFSQFFIIESRDGKYINVYSKEKLDYSKDKSYVFFIDDNFVVEKLEENK